LYWAIIAQYSEAMAILDLKGRYIQQNPAHSLLLGYSDDELAKLTTAFHLGEEVFALIRKELLNNGRFCGQVTSYTKSGHLLTLELETFVVCNDAGEPIYYVETKRNLTDHKPF
jgi:PAS domain S-box-containing protein